MKKNYLFPLLAGLVLALSSCDTGKNLNKTTVENVDLTRYMGKWYEIARFDFSFEKGLVGTTAEYTLKSDGTVAVVNRGFEKTLDGKPTVAEGKARGRKSGKSGELEVAFFLNFYADYNILELDTVDYNYVLVGGSNDKYLWILSRTPQMNAVDKEMLLTKATARGYNINKLLWIPQPVVEN